MAADEVPRRRIAVRAEVMRDHEGSQIVGRPFIIEEPSGAGCLIIQNALQFREQLSIVVKLPDQTPSQTTAV
jgi:hypothetical protein